MSSDTKISNYVASLDDQFGSTYYETLACGRNLSPQRPYSIPTHYYNSKCPPLIILYYILNTKNKKKTKQKILHEHNMIVEITENHGLNDV